MTTVCPTPCSAATVECSPVALLPCHCAASCQNAVLPATLSPLPLPLQCFPKAEKKYMSSPSVTCVLPPYPTIMLPPYTATTVPCRHPTVQPPCLTALLPCCHATLLPSWGTFVATLHPMCPTISMLHRATSGGHYTVLSSQLG